MKIQLQNIRLLLKRVGFYIPFTWYFVLFILASYLGYQWLQNQAGIPDSAYKDIFTILLKFATWFCLVIVLLGLITVLFSFFFFIWKQKKTGIDFNLTTLSRGETEQSKQTIELHIHPIIKPLLGFIKIRLKYDKEHFSEKFYVLKKSQKNLFNTTLDGIYNWLLPEIKEYHIEKAIIYFEDFFQFFSFAVTINTNSNFHTQPVIQKAKVINAFPRKTEDTSIRIEELKKVEGELINYKNFESNDDVRRIVWKIYAKNKELVVRIPEVIDPYASHVYLYASFFSSFNIVGNDVIKIPFLNYYKTICWSVYKQLAEKGFEIRYVPYDQDISQNKMSGIEEQIKYSISISNWQSEKGLRDYVKANEASVVIVSSLSNIDEIQELLEKYGNDISFIFVQLTDSLNKQHFGDWLQWLFIQQEKDSIAVYKTNWSLSLLRLKIEKNEKQIKKLLEGYDKSMVLQKSVV